AALLAGLACGTRRRAVWGLAALGCCVLALTPLNLIDQTVIRRDGQIVYHADDQYGSVTFQYAFDTEGKELAVELNVDGFNMMGSTMRARRYATMLPVLPVLLSRHQDDVLVIALGVGNSFC